MSRGRKKSGKSHEPLDPASLAGLNAAFVDWMTHDHFSPHTLRVRGNDLKRFVAWCEERGITRPTEVSRAILEHYRKHLYEYRQKDGKGLSLLTQIHHLTAIRVFFRWMARHHHILYNVAAELEIPREPRRLPRIVLSVQEVEETINQADVGQPLGIRDRAILEVLYSTGMRRSELINLKLEDISLDQGIIMIRHGKGDKDRVVPIGDRAAAWVEKYVTEVRPLFAKESDIRIAFLTIRSGPISNNRMSELANGYLGKVRKDCYGACHLFRHAMATHMLEGGADIRIIQAILGHENLSTTAIYTRVSIAHLKAVHARTHPARLRRRASVPVTDQTDEAAKLLDALVESEDDDKD